MPPKKKKLPLSPRALQLVARRFQILSQPARLSLLAALEQGEKNVSALVGLTGLSQGNVSKHLGILMEAGMIARRKHGVQAFYFISDPKILELCDLMCSRLTKDLAERSSHFRRPERARRREAAP